MHLAELIKNGITHKGFSLIDVFSPCVTFNYLNTYDWFRSRVYKMDSNSHNVSDKSAALKKAVEDEETDYEKLPLGLFYKTDKPIYEDLDITLKDGPLIKQPMPTKEKILELLGENQ